MFNRFLRYLAISVYPAFLPTGGGIYQGAEEYFVDIRRSAPARVFFVQMLSALFIYFSPLVYFVSFKPLPYLSEEKQAGVLKKLMRSRLYSIRLIFYSTRGQAFIAILRNDKAREYFGLNQK